MNKEKKTILLAEDDALVSQMYQTKLSAEGYGVIAVYNGEDALLQLEKANPDLVLLDINMPKQNGFYVLGRLKANPKWAGIPVVMLTNLDELNDINKAIEMGASDYIVKSHHTVDDVAAKIKKYLAV